MSHPPTTPSPEHPHGNHGARNKDGEFGRRQFLHLVAGGALAAGISATPSCAAQTSDPGGERAHTSDASGIGTATDRSSAGDDDGGDTSPNRKVPSVGADRTLIVVDLRGGNDGLDTVIPYADPAYLGLRPNLGVPAEEVLPLDDEVGLNPALARLHDRTVASIEGVGLGSPSFSHSDCVRRWANGDTRIGDRYPTGFLGRLCDQLDVGAPATGVSLAFEPSTALVTEKARTAVLPDARHGGWILNRDDPWNAAIAAGLGTMARPSSPNPLIDRAGMAIADVLGFAEVLGDLPDRPEDYEWGELSQRLAVASQLITADLGVRIIHVPLGGFDTHDEHRWRHDNLLGELDVAVDTFLGDMEQQGHGDSVLVATISEFGRRPGENKGGTDHGSASVALLAGAAVNAGRYGKQPSLTKLVDDNLRVELNVSDYYATLAESWFGIPAGDVLSADATPIPGVITA